MGCGTEDVPLGLPDRVDVDDRLRNSFVVSGCAIAGISTGTISTLSNAPGKVCDPSAGSAGISRVSSRVRESDARRDGAVSGTEASGCPLASASDVGASWVRGISWISGITLIGAGDSVSSASTSDPAIGPEGGSSERE